MAREAKYTPGPWGRSLVPEECECGHGEAWKIRVKDRTGDITIAEVRKTVPRATNRILWAVWDAEGKANAALIAAAPELLEALEILLDGNSHLDAFGEKVAREAIAKAKAQ